MNTKDTLILFGRSPFIHTIPFRIPEIISRYPISVGCNSFAREYPEVPYCGIIDFSALRALKEYKGTIITQKALLEHVKGRKNQTYYIDKYDHYMQNPRKEHLFALYDTPSMICSWGISLGLKNIVLIGVDYNPDTREHFDNPNHKLNWSEDKFKRARSFLEYDISSHINVYKVNPESPINVNYISIEDLLRG